MVKQLLKIWNYLHTPRENTATNTEKQNGNGQNKVSLTKNASNDKTNESSDSDDTEPSLTTTTIKEKNGDGHQHSIIELSTDSSHTSDAEESNGEYDDVLAANLSCLQVHDSNDDNVNVNIEYSDGLGDDILPNDALLVYNGQEEEEGKDINDTNIACELDIKTQIIQAIQRDKQLYTKILHYKASYLVLQLLYFD
jgi:hypothetical protein